jgi:transcriptional regulator CtsR
MMSNIADLIEEYILRRLSAQQSRKVELRRTDIADAISCAPSQISYVLSTRFTLDKGFLVESRRGLGGFIRIAQGPIQNLIYQEILDKIDETTEIQEIQSMVRYLLQHQLIQSREAALIMQVATTAYAKLLPEDRVQLIQSMFLTLENFT